MTALRLKAINYSESLSCILDGDTNANLTRRILQITYRLVDGEASCQFVVDKVVDL